MHPREFHYTVRFPVKSIVPGFHASRAKGSGLEIAGLAPLAAGADPRRLDLRASLRDPFEGYWVREFEQRASVALWLLLDTSASVRTTLTGSGPSRAHAAAIDFARSLQYSAARTGDAFGMAPFDARLRDDLLTPASRTRGLSAAAVQRVSEDSFTGRGAQGLVRAAALLPRRPALVFLVSDFLFPLATLDQALAETARHDVVPVLLDTCDELDTLPAFGLVQLRDAETGASRTVWMRPQLKRRWRENIEAHREAVAACLARHQRSVLPLAERFDADAVSRYFAARS